MLSYILHICLACFRRWKNSPRMIILILVNLCVLLSLILPFVENAAAQNEKLQIGEIFCALGNWRFTPIVFGTSVMLMFCDVPVVDMFTINVLLKGNKRAWLTGQIFYIFAASFLYAAGILLLTIIAGLPDISLDNAWSRPIKLMATSGRVAINPEKIRLGMNSAVISMAKPYAALVHSFLLFVISGVVYGLASMVLRMFIRNGGFFVLVTANVFSWICSMFGVGESGYAIFSMLSVNYHASFYMHSAATQNPGLASLPQSYAILFAVICVLIMAACFRLKKYDFADNLEEVII